MSENFDFFSLFSALFGDVNNTDNKINFLEWQIIDELLTDDELNGNTPSDPSYDYNPNVANPDDWAERLQHISTTDIYNYVNNTGDIIDSALDSISVNTFLPSETIIGFIINEARSIAQTPVKNDLDGSNGLENGINPKEERAIKHFLDFIGQDVANKDIATILSDLKSDIESSEDRTKPLDSAFVQKQIGDYKEIYGLDTSEANKLVKLLEKATGFDLIVYS